MMPEPLIRDLTLDQRPGVTHEKHRYGYRPDHDDRSPGARDDWVILCTVPGAEGPYTRTRSVLSTSWVLDPRDSRSEPSAKLIVEYDVTGFTRAEIDALALEAHVQYERSDDHPSCPVEPVIHYIGTPTGETP